MKNYYKKFNNKKYKELMSSMEETTKFIRDICEGDELRVYGNNDVRKRLGISEGLLLRYRHESLLPFSRVGDKYFYTDEDIEQFTENTSSRRFDI